MTTPSDPGGAHHVVVNDEVQHALLALVHRGPHRWGVAPEESSRAEDLGVHWTDMRPRSVVREMEIADNGAGVLPL